MKLRLAFPGPCRLDIAVALALLLLILQLATGTALEFAELTFIGVVFSVVAVNLAGGLRTVAGCCLAIVALQVFVIAEIGKVCWGEPGQSRLEQPFVTMGVLALSMVGLGAACLVCRTFQPKQVLFKPVSDLEMLRVMAILGCLLGLAALFGGRALGESEEGTVQLGGLAGLLRRFTGCTPLAIIAGTAYTVLTSRGARLFSIYNSVPFCCQMAIGIFYSSKQGMFEPLLNLVLTGIAFRFPWRRVHLISAPAIWLVSVFVIFPFGQVARNFTTGVNLADRFNKNVAYFEENLKNPRYLIDQYLDYKDSLEAEDGFLYFNHPNGLLERMSLIKPADALISATLRQGQSGWETIQPGLEDLLPRVILPRRFVNTPNVMGYKAGFVDEDNTGTCISFGFAADAFGSFGWAGVAVIPFFIGILVICVTRLLTTALPGNIWGVVFLVGFYHVVAEASVGSVLSIFISQSIWNILSLFLILGAAQIWVSVRRARRTVALTAAAMNRGPVQS
jgi:hypothetical protein